MPPSISQASKEPPIHDHAAVGMAEYTSIAAGMEAADRMIELDGRRWWEIDLKQDNAE